MNNTHYYYDNIHIFYKCNIFLDASLYSSFAATTRSQKLSTWFQMWKRRYAPIDFRDMFENIYNINHFVAADFILKETVNIQAYTDNTACIKLIVSAKTPLSVGKIDHIELW